MNNCCKGILALIFLALLFSCKHTTSPQKPDASGGGGGENEGEEENVGGETDNVKEVEEMFVEADDGWRKFEVDEDKYLDWTFWASAGQSAEGEFEGAAIEAAKENGNGYGGFGLVFGEQEYLGRHFILCAMINANGSYTVGKAKGGAFESIVPWTQSANLSRGYGVVNKICVVPGDDGKYRLLLNGEEECSFAVEEDVPLLGARWGYVTVVLPSEQFPQVPVRTRFRPADL